MFCQTILDGFVSISKVSCLLQPSQQNHTLADSQAVIPGITHRWPKAWDDCGLVCTDEKQFSEVKW